MFAATASARTKDRCPCRGGKPPVDVPAPQAVGRKLSGNMSVGSAVPGAFRFLWGRGARVVQAGVVPRGDGGGGPSAGHGRCSCVRAGGRSPSRVLTGNSGGVVGVAPPGVGVGAVGTGCHCVGAYGDTRVVGVRVAAPTAVAGPIVAASFGCLDFEVSVSGRWRRPWGARSGRGSEVVAGGQRAFQLSAGCSWCWSIRCWRISKGCGRPASVRAAIVPLSWGCSEIMIHCVSRYQLLIRPGRKPTGG